LREERNKQTNKYKIEKGFSRKGGDRNTLRAVLFIFQYTKLMQLISDAA
jgi:hypothetical protein